MASAPTGRAQLTARPLPQWERGALALALGKAGLATDDVQQPGRLFWRFETPEQVLIGFGGLEVFAPHALMRSVLTVPPVRGRGFGRAIVEGLEVEAIVLKCRTAWLITTSAQDFFAHLGYSACDRESAPDTVRATRQFSSLCPETATMMMKRLR
jgi:N-acetylglutamate synthase-like GNAT family acetyltransferase